MYYPLFRDFYASFGKLLDSLDNNKVSIRFKEQSLIMMQVREIKRQEVLMYDEYLGTTATERYEALLERIHAERWQRFTQSMRDDGLSDQQIKERLQEQQEKTVEERLHIFLKAQREKGEI